MKTTKPNNILIIHGFESNSRQHWFLGAKEKFEKEGYKVFVPDMPSAFFPKKDEWVETISSFNPDENWILIGHSLGGNAILRYLEIADNKVAKVILMATPYEPMKFGAIENFFTCPPVASSRRCGREGEFDWNLIKSKTNEIIVLNEDNDPFVPLEHGKKFSEYLNCPLLVQPGFVHFDKIDLDFMEKLINE